MTSSLMVLDRTLNLHTFYRSLYVYVQVEISTIARPVTLIRARTAIVAPVKRLVLALDLTLQIAREELCTKNRCAVP